MTEGRPLTAPPPSKLPGRACCVLSRGGGGETASAQTHSQATNQRFTCTRQSTQLLVRQREG